MSHRTGQNSREEQLEQQDQLNFRMGIDLGARLVSILK